MEIKEIEIWKPVVGYEGLYEVSSQGNVKSVKYWKERMLKPHCMNGYLLVRLSKNGKSKNYLIHRLVASAFIPNPDPENFNIVNHMDECKTNNCMDNLEWCDHKHNMNWGTIQERRRQTGIANGTISPEGHKNSKEYREENRERIKEYRRQYKKEHREELREKGRQYYQEHKEERKKYYQDNKDKAAEYRRQYQKEHREELNKKHSKYYQDHKEERREYSRKYAEENRDKMIEYKRQYYYNHLEHERERRRLYYHKKKQQSQPVELSLFNF